MLLFFVHEPQAYKGRRAKEPNLNCARYAFRFSSSAATVPSTIISENRFLSPAEPTGFNGAAYPPFDRPPFAVDSIWTRTLFTRTHDL